MIGRKRRDRTIPLKAFNMENATSIPTQNTFSVLDSEMSELECTSHNENSEKHLKKAL